MSGRREDHAAAFGAALEGCVLFARHGRVLTLIEPPCTERYARWCERSNFLHLQKFRLLDFTGRWPLQPKYGCLGTGAEERRWHYGGLAGAKLWPAPYFWLFICGVIDWRRNLKWTFSLVSCKI